MTEKTDVAFRPFGLDLFDKLVRACKAVKVKLEIEQRTLNNSSLGSIQALFPAGTQVAKLLSSITSLTNPETIHTLANFTNSDEQRIADLERSLIDLQANDPQKSIQQLQLRVARLRVLDSHLKSIEVRLSTAAIERILQIRTDGRRKSEEAKSLREAAFPSNMLAGTGADNWKSLWESARVFSNEQAYPQNKFPVVEDGAKCVLCQQILNENASARLQKFEEFVVSTAERELRNARELFLKLRKEFTDVKVITDEISSIVSEIQIESEAEAKRKEIADALVENRDVTQDFKQQFLLRQSYKN